MIDLEKTPVNELLGKKVHYIRYPYKAESGICVGINKKSKGTLTMTADTTVIYEISAITGGQVVSRIQAVQQILESEVPPTP